VNIVLKTGERREATTTFGRVQSNEHGREFKDGEHVNLNATYGVLFAGGASVTSVSRRRCAQQQPSDHFQLAGRW
jgi:hypothetical protein